MNREWALKFVMVVAGLLFVAGIFPLALSLLYWQHSEAVGPMMLSLYVTLGVFLLLAVRNPSAHRSLIAFTAWSSLAHVFVMLIQTFEYSDRALLWGMSAVLVAIGLPLLALTPQKRSEERAPAFS